MRVSPMQTIHSWDEVARFAGRVVAFTSDSVYSNTSEGYTLGPTHYGYIDDIPSTFAGGEVGYNMATLVRPTDVRHNCFLVNSLLKSPFSMRLATKREVELLGKAITDNHAGFQFMSDKEHMLDILQQHLSLLTESFR